MNIHVTAIASALGDYCGNEAWIRAKYHVKKPTSDVMLLGTIVHHLMETIDEVSIISKVNTIEKVNRKLSSLLLDSYLDYKREYPDNNYDSIEERVLDYVTCLAYRFTSRFYKLQLLSKEYHSDWVIEEPFKKHFDIDGNTVYISGRIDRYKIISEGKCVVADYKTSAKPILNDTMKIQLDGYALLLYEKYGLETVIGQIDFPLYQITEYYVPDKDQFRDVYIPLYVEMMHSDKLPPYYIRPSCTYCEDAVRKNAWSYDLNDFNNPNE